jgi:hypothetical protein
MRAAPPAEAIAALRGGWWVAACGLWLSCLACFGGWLVWHGSDEAALSFSAELPLILPIFLLAIGTLAAAGTLLWHARQEPMRLSWTGSHWVCEPLAAVPLRAQPDARLGGVDLMLDLGDAMLLCWQSLPGTRRQVFWLPVSRGPQADAWHGLRVALSLPTPPATPKSGVAT